MDASDFTRDAPGRLVQAPEECWAFVPEPLPPALEFDLKTVRQLSLADLALGHLAGIGEMLPNPHLLIGPFLRREAVLSSRIEGTIASLEQLLRFEVQPSQRPHPTDVLEVANYVTAMEYGLARLNELPVCLRLIRELHGKLLIGVRGEQHRPGEFRQIQNYIGNPAQSIDEARFVPPPVADMTSALNKLEQFIHASKESNEIPPLIRLALIHYQFEAIHPFLDGNGRIGRLLIPLLLCEEGCLPQPLLYLSAYFERNRNVYMDLLLRVSQAGAWTDWVRFFLAGVAEQAQDAVQRSQRLLNLWQEYRQRTQTARASALLLHLVDQLIASPVITIPQAQKILNVTHRSAQHCVDRLVAADILEEVTDRQRNRVYIAAEVLDVINTEQSE